MDRVHQDEEQNWVRRAAAGDRAAFAALVARYWRPVRAWLYGLCGEFHTAEDMAQDVFLRAWKSLPKLANAEVFRVWLFRIARNEYLARQRSPRVGKLAELPPEIAGPRTEPLTGLLEKEGASALNEAVGRLPILFQEAYLLWTNAEWPYSEIARVLETTEETARWRVCEARRRLVGELGPLLERTER